MLFEKCVVKAVYCGSQDDDHVFYHKPPLTLMQFFTDFLVMEYGNFRSHKVDILDNGVL